MSKKRKRYAADFEATTTADDCRVWGYGYMNIDDFSDTVIGEKLDDFMEWSITQDADIYFHNLKYDGWFILNWLFRNGFAFDDDIKPQPFTFNTTISAQGGQWYKIDVTMKYTKKGGGREERRHVTFMDSLKKLPFPIARIAKAFNLPVLKGDIDYQTYRSPEHVLTPEERAYIQNDIEILARAMSIQFEQGLTNITIGTDAMKDFKARLKAKGTKLFENSFPVLDTETDSYLRASYKGGYTYVNPKYQGIDINGGCVFDVNSLYPYVMYEKMMPFGRPVKFEGQYEHDNEYPLYIAKFRCEFTLKEGYIPTIQIKGSRFNETDYLTNSEGEQVTLTLTSVDITLMEEHYDVFNVEWIDGYKFRQNNNFFKDYIDYWSDIKKNSEGAIRELAKLMLNNLYGKFGKNPNVTQKFPVLLEDGSVKLDVRRDYYGEKMEEYDEAVYIPMGSFITSYAREKTIRAAQENYERFIYADTDSLHLVGKEFPTNIAIDSKELGFWAHETTFERGKFIRQKTYVEQFYITRKYPNQKKKLVRLYTDIKCAGMMDSVKKTVSYNEFGIGLHREFGKLQPKSVPNGVILVDAPYTMM